MVRMLTSRPTVFGERLLDSDLVLNPNLSCDPPAKDHNREYFNSLGGLDRAPERKAFSWLRDMCESITPEAEGHLSPLGRFIGVLTCLLTDMKELANFRYALFTDRKKSLDNLILFIQASWERYTQTNNLLWPLCAVENPAVINGLLNECLKAAWNTNVDLLPYLFEGENCLEAAVVRYLLCLAMFRGVIQGHLTLSYLRHFVYAYVTDERKDRDHTRRLLLDDKALRWMVDYYSYRNSPVPTCDPEPILLPRLKTSLDLEAVQGLEPSLVAISRRGWGTVSLLAYRLMYHSADKKPDFMKLVAFITILLSGPQSLLYYRALYRAVRKSEKRFCLNRENTEKGKSVNGVSLERCVWKNLNRRLGFRIDHVDEDFVFSYPYTPDRLLNDSNLLHTKMEDFMREILVDSPLPWQSHLLHPEIIKGMGKVIFRKMDLMGADMPESWKILFKRRLSDMRDEKKMLDAEKRRRSARKNHTDRST